MTQSSSSGYIDLLRENANFRYLWFGQIVSLLGDWFNLIASASLIASLTGSGAAVGGLFVVRMLAPFLISPIAGVAADRYNRKHLLIVTDLVRAVIVVGFLFVREPDDVWMLYVLTALQLGVSGFFFPTRNAILPDLVDRSQLGAANALSSATWSVMLALGTALGGLVSGGFGVYPAFAIDALTFLVSAAIIARISYHHAPGLASTTRGVGRVFRQYADGLGYLKRHRDIFAVTLHKAAVSLFVSGGFQVLQVVVAEQVYVIGEGGGYSMGLLFAVTGIGTGLGPILARRFTGDRDRALRSAIVWGYLIGALGIAVTAPLLGFGVVLIGMFLRGFGGGIVWVFSTQLLLHLLPDDVRGRVFSTEFAMFTLANALSAAAVGWALNDTVEGLTQIMWVMAILGVVPAVLWALWNRGEHIVVEHV
ncbi:MAG: MFS transporter [Caldilineaceae bacterium]|nr:MFS transporter [Caldilineaceae bacterium]